VKSKILLIIDTKDILDAQVAETVIPWVKSSAVCSKRALLVPTLCQPSYLSSVVQTDCL